jgi:putative transposase
MPFNKYKPEEVIGKLREAEILLAQGSSTAEACRRIAVSEHTYYRWRKEYGGLKNDQARRMKDLEKENARLPRPLPRSGSSITSGIWRIRISIVAGLSISSPSFDFLYTEAFELQPEPLHWTHSYRWESQQATLRPQIIVVS